MNETAPKNKKETTIEGLKRYYFAGLTAFLVLAAAIIFYLFTAKFATFVNIINGAINILQPIVFGLIIAYLMAPTVRFFDRVFRPFAKKYIKKNPERWIRGISIFISLAIWLTMIILLILMIIPQLIKNITYLINTAPSEIRQFAAALTKLLEKTGMDTDGINDLTNSIVQKINSWIRTDLPQNLEIWFGQFASGMVNVLSVTFNFIVGFIVAIYVLNGRRIFKRQLKQIIYAVFSDKHAEMVIGTLRESNEIFTGFISGKLVDSLIIGILCFIGLLIFRMPYVLLVSVIVGVTNIIPFFGPYLGAVPSAILILLNDPVKGLIFIVFIVILQQFDGNILGPRILGESTGLSAFWVVFAILLFGGIFGIIGMLFGVPVFAVIYRVIANIVDHLLRKKGRDDIADLGIKEKETDKQ